MDAVKAAAEYAEVVKRIPEAQVFDKTLLRQVFEGAVYIRQCIDDHRPVELKKAYPWPLAAYYPDWRAVYGHY